VKKYKSAIFTLYNGKVNLFQGSYAAKHIEYGVFFCAIKIIYGIIGNQEIGSVTKFILTIE